MATLIGSMYVSLAADMSPFQRNMRSAEGVVSTSAGRMRREMGLTATSADRLRSSFSQNYRARLFGDSLRTITRTNDEVQRLRASFVALSAITGAGFTGALSGAYLVQTADRARLLSNQLRTVTSSSEDLAATQERLFDISQRTRSSLQATTTIYARTARATESFGLSQEKLLRITETIQKAFAIGGATSAEAFGAAVQLSQGIASDRFSGEEFRSVAENAPVLLRGIAESLGVNIGKLREMAHAGELTARTVTEAIINASRRIDQEFAQTEPTVGQAITRLDNAFLRYMGNVDAAYGVTTSLANAVTSLANNLEDVAYWAGLALGGGLAAFGGRSAGGGVSRTLGSIKREGQIRRENLRLAREEFYVSRKQQIEADKALATARQAPTSGVQSLAPRSMLSEVARQEQQLNRINSERLKNTAQQIEARKRLADVTVTTSRSAIRAADAQIASEAKLAGLRQDMIKLERDEAIARRKASVRFTVDTPGMEAVERKKQGERDLIRLTKERETLTASIGRQETDLAQRRLAVTNLASDAERRAANERLDARRKLIALDREAVAIQQRADAQRRAIVQARGSAAAAGQGVMDQGIGAASAAATGAAAAVGRAREQLTLAARAASGFSTALGVVRNVGSSLVGFLGGPWGVAFTAAIGLLTLFGSRSLYASQQLAQARSIISDELALLNEQSTRELMPSQQVAIFSDQILAASERLRTVEDRLSAIKQEAMGIAATSFFSEIGSAGAGQLKILEDAWATVTREVNNGSLAISDLGKRLLELGVGQDVVDAVVADIKDLITEGRSAEVVVAAIRDRINELDGKRAIATVQIDVVDPYNILTGGDPGLIDRAMQDEIRQRRLYGRGQRSGFEAQRRAMAQRAERNRAVDDPGQKVEDRAMRLLSDGIAKTRPEAMALASELIRLEEQTKNAGRAGKSAAKDMETFANKISELREQSEGAYLSELDRKVVEFAKSLKNGSEMMRQYIEAVNSGDLSQAPRQLIEVRDALMQIGAADTWRQIMQQYGRGGQLAAQFAEKQAELNYLVQQGKITAEQAGVAYSDFVTSFGEYAWINDVSSAISGFASSAILDFENIEDAAKNLLRRLAEIALQALILKPLEDSLRSSLSAGATTGSSFGGGGGGIGSLVSSVLGFIFHDGSGSVGRGGPGRMVPASTFANAPRYHNGNLKGKEIAAILEEGEAVLKQRDANKMAGVVSGLTSRISQGTATFAPVYNIDARGADQAAITRLERGLAEVNRTFDKRVDNRAQTRQIRKTRA